MSRKTATVSDTNDLREPKFTHGQYASSSQRQPFTHDNVVVLFIRKEGDGTYSIIESMDQNIADRPLALHDLKAIATEVEEFEAIEYLQGLLRRLK